MPRILRIHNRIVIGGPTLNVLNLTKYLAPGYETMLVAGEKEDHEKDASALAHAMNIEPVLVSEMGRSVSAKNDVAAYNRIKKLIKEFKPDIVHTHAAKPGLIGRLAAASCKVPVIVHTFHGHVFHSYFSKTKTRLIINTERYLATKANAIVAISEQQKKELALDFKIAREKKFRIIPLGFELDRFTLDQDEKRYRFRNEFQVADNEIAIGITGRLVPVKNHEVFLKGLSHVLQNTGKKVRAFIVGDGETRQQLEAWAAALNIPYTAAGDNFDATKPLVFTSWRGDIDVINAGLDIVTLTSLNEGTPVSLIEAQASNKPIVSTRVGGIQDIVIENETALLSGIHDQQLFSDNLLQLVNNDELRNRMGSTGSDWVIKKFSAQRLANDMDHLYQALLRKKRIHGR